MNNWQTYPSEYDFTNNMRDPYRNVSVSILLPTKDFIGFSKMIQSLIKTCSDVNAVEIIIKTDSENTSEEYRKFLMDSPFLFKILCFPKYRKYFDQHLFINDLTKISQGKILWSMGDDVIITSGDWLKYLSNTRDRYFGDNIYCIHVGENPQRPSANPFPALTREWVDFFGCFSPVSTLDSFNINLAKKIGRYLDVPTMNINMIHQGPHGYMKNDKLSHLSKKQRHYKHLVYQYVEKFIKNKKDIP